MAFPGIPIIIGSEHTRTTFVELKAPIDETDPQESPDVHLFTPQLTIEKNGLVIGINSHTPKALLELALEAAFHV